MSMFTQWVPESWSQEPHDDDLKAYANRLYDRFDALQCRCDFLRCHGSLLRVQFEAVDCDLAGTRCQGGAPMRRGFAGRSVSIAGRAANSVTHRRRHEVDRAFCSDARIGRRAALASKCATVPTPL